VMTISVIGATGKTGVYGTGSLTGHLYNDVN
jgi:hypothetical protein